MFTYVNAIDTEALKRHGKNIFYLVITTKSYKTLNRLMISRVKIFFYLVITTYKSLNRFSISRYNDLEVVITIYAKST